MLPFKSFFFLIEVPFCSFTLFSGRIGGMGRGAPNLLVGKISLLVLSPGEPGTVHLEPQLRSSSIGMVSDCLLIAPAVILGGPFFVNFIFKAPPPGVN